MENINEVDVQHFLDDYDTGFSGIYIEGRGQAEEFLNIFLNYVSENK